MQLSVASIKISDVRVDQERLKEVLRQWFKKKQADRYSLMVEVRVGNKKLEARCLGSG
jgi:hypothetical protein